MARLGPTFAFTPEPPPDSDSPGELKSWVNRQFERLNDALNSIVPGSMDQLHAAPSKPRDGMVRLADGTDWNPGFGAGPYVFQDGAWRPMASGAFTECWIINVTNEFDVITTGTAKRTFRAPYAFNVSAVRSSVNTVSSSGVVTMDINEEGTSILSTKLSIDASEKVSTTAATPAVISDAALADFAEITLDVDAAGTGAKGLVVYIFGTRV
jgi:hypothetical protein